MDAYKSRRLRIVDKSLENYTGLLGTVEFEHGVSVDLVPWIEAGRLGAIVHIEDADQEDYQVSESAEIERSQDLAADDIRVTDFDRSHQLDGETKLALDHYTREQLEAIADKEGLAGVRELARQRGGTGRSILECIESVLKNQAAENAKREASV